MTRLYPKYLKPDGQEYDLPNHKGRHRSTDGSCLRSGEKCVNLAMFWEVAMGEDAWIIFGGVASGRLGASGLTASVGVKVVVEGVGCAAVFGWQK